MVLVKPQENPTPKSSGNWERPREGTLHICPAPQHLLHSIEGGRICSYRALI